MIWTTIPTVDTNGPTSVYISKELKRQLVETAEAEGFQVGRGRRSRLADFIGTMLHEHGFFSEHHPTISSLRSLTPELRSSIVKLSQMNSAQQKRACAMLALLFDGNEPTQE